MSTPPTPPTAPAGDGGNDDARAELAALTTVFSAARQRHVLDGDGSGGGHRYGVLPAEVDVPKTWFPRTWSDADVVAAVNSVLENPEVARWSRKRAFINAYGEIRGARIKVRVAPSGLVITAHPLDGDGVAQVRLLRDGTVKGPAELPYGRSREVKW